MKTLVTGGAGFIGSHICEALLKQGHEVISVDNYIAGHSSNLEHIKHSPNFKEVFCDILDVGQMARLLQGVDVVFHQAASKKNVCERSPVMDLETNAKGTLQLLEMCVNAGVKKFIHASTGSVYGEAMGIQDENHPVNPVSYYGISKLAGEKYVMLFKDRINVTVLRYFHVYGKRQDCSSYGGVVSIFNDNLLKHKALVIYGDGTQERSFTHVDDVVKANLFAMENDSTNGQVYNCASGISVTINELADAMIKLHGETEYPVIYSQWLPGDIKRFEIDNRKIKHEMGIIFTIDLKEGLRKTI